MLRSKNVKKMEEAEKEPNLAFSLRLNLNDINLENRFKIKV